MASTAPGSVTTGTSNTGHSVSGSASDSTNSTVITGTSVINTGFSVITIDTTDNYTITVNSSANITVITDYLTVFSENSINKITFLGEDAIFQSLKITEI